MMIGAPRETHLRLPAVFRQSESRSLQEVDMASEKQRVAARKNIKKAIAASKQKRTISHLPKETRTALGKQASKSGKKRLDEIGHDLLDEGLETALAL